jgi:glutamate-1-semialdehyde 2,1-aminomutase
VSIPVQTGAMGSMWGFFLVEGSVHDFDTAKRADTKRYARLFHALRDRGVYIAPSQFEAAFVSTAHDDSVLEETERALTEAFEVAAE